MSVCDLKTSNLAMLVASATQETGRWPPRKHSTKNIIVDNGHSILIQRSNPHGQVYDLIRTDRYFTIDIQPLGPPTLKKVRGYAPAGYKGNIVCSAMHNVHSDKSSKPSHQHHGFKQTIICALWAPYSLNELACPKAQITN